MRHPKKNENDDDIIATRSIQVGYKYFLRRSFQFCPWPILNPCFDEKLREDASVGVVCSAASLRSALLASLDQHTDAVRVY